MFHDAWGSHWVPDVLRPSPYAASQFAPSRDRHLHPERSIAQRDQLKRSFELTRGPTYPVYVYRLPDSGAHQGSSDGNAPSSRFEIIDGHYRYEWWASHKQPISTVVIHGIDRVRAALLRIARARDDVSDVDLIAFTSTHRFAAQAADKHPEILFGRDPARIDALRNEAKRFCDGERFSVGLLNDLREHLVRKCGPDPLVPLAFWPQSTSGELKARQVRRAIKRHPNLGNKPLSRRLGITPRFIAAVRAAVRAEQEQRGRNA